MLSPFRGFRELQGEMDRLFGEALRLAPHASEKAEWMPAIDVTAEDEDLIVRAELPGVRREDVDVTFSEGVLTVSGERKEETERKDAGYLVRERRYGSFRRSMALPEGVDESKISARFEGGVLELRIRGGVPGVERQPKSIEIEG